MNEFGHRISGVESLGECRLRLTYADGSRRDFDFAREAAVGQAFAHMNEPDFVGQAKIINFGGGLAFSADVDYCADFLWLEGTPVATPEPVASVSR